MGMKSCRKLLKKICKNGAVLADQNDIWEKYVRRLLVSGIFRRAERKSDKESSHVVGIIHNNASARTCRLLRFGGEPP
mgnify:CR=1 FL=1